MVTSSITTHTTSERIAEMAFLDDFVIRALLSGLGVAMVAGPLGCFVVWRRMAYFGDAIAHSSLAGVALGLALSLNVNTGIVITCILFALGIIYLQERRHLATDTLLGILAHASLAIGLVVVSFLDNIRIDLMSFLFGDILAVTRNDLIWVYTGGIAILSVLVWIWRPLFALSVHEDIARSEGIPVFRTKVIFTLLLAMTIAISMKIVGVILIVAMLIIPAAAGRRFAKSPEQMALLASIFGAAAVGGGLFASLQWDTPSGPSIVVTAFVLFVVSLTVPAKAHL